MQSRVKCLLSREEVLAQSSSEPGWVSVHGAPVCVFLVVVDTQQQKKRREDIVKDKATNKFTLRITHQHESRLRIFPPAQCCPHCLPEHSIEIAQAHFSPSFDTRLLRWEYHQEPCGLFEGDARTRTILEIAWC